MSDDPSKNSSTKNSWARNPGSLAWAALPAAAMSKLSTAATITKKQRGEQYSSDSFNWPVILYPSWSYAAKQSGLLIHHTFENEFSEGGGGGDVKRTTKNKKRCKSSTPTTTPPNGKKDGTGMNSMMVHFMGCKTAVTVDQMSKNMVPKRVALGSTSIKGQTLRPKVVAYFLGLHGSRESTMFEDDEDDHNEALTCSPWTAVNVNDVQIYNIDSCKENMKSMYNDHGQEEEIGESIKSDTPDTTTAKNKVLEKGRYLIWKRFILAMEEASIVMEDEEYHPKHFINELSKPNIKNDANCNGSKKRARFDTFASEEENEKSSSVSLLDDDKTPLKKKSKNDIENSKKCFDSKQDVEKSSNEKKKNSNSDEKIEAFKEVLTPECFSDWRIGGNTVNHSDSQSQFVLSAGTII